MNILAFTDVHAHKGNMQKILKKAEKADILICCGDMTYFGMELKKVMGFLARNTDKKILMIHGNHEERSTVQELHKDFPSIIPIHGRIVAVGDLLFFGYGGGGFAQRDLRLEALIPKVKERVQGKKLIVVTHAIPYNTAIDHLPVGHVGCKSIRMFIEEVQPVAAFCGHLHENFGLHDTIGKTIIINPGDEGKIIEIK